MSWVRNRWNVTKFQLKKLIAVSHKELVTDSTANDYIMCAISKTETEEKEAETWSKESAKIQTFLESRKEGEME